jgi:hypothetical protein
MESDMPRPLSPSESRCDIAFPFVRLLVRHLSCPASHHFWGLPDTLGAGR